MSQNLESFEQTYRAHVDMVVAGDLKGVMSDMDPAALAHVFDGVDVPRGEVSGAQIVAASVDADRAVGEAIYHTSERIIGLRSGWRFDEGRWLADKLENFEPIPHMP